MRRRAIAPPGQEGCRAHQEISRSDQRVRGGVVDQGPIERNLLIHHPVCAKSVTSRLFLDRAATPPGQEGDGSPVSPMSPDVQPEEG